MFVHSEFKDLMVSRPPSFLTLITYKLFKTGSTNTYAPNLSLDQFSLLFGNARKGLWRSIQAASSWCAPSFDLIALK